MTKSWRRFCSWCNPAGSTWDWALLGRHPKPREHLHQLPDTQIAMVEADEGVAVIPSIGLATCGNRRVFMNRLVNPLVSIGLCLISNRAKKLPGGANGLAAS